jgi:hypothetical protein
MGTKHMQMTLWKSGVTWQISPELMIAGPMSNQHKVLKMGDTLPPAMESLPRTQQR